MLNINYTQNQYNDLTKDAAMDMQAFEMKNYFNLPGNIPDGCYKYIFLSNGLQCLIADYKLTRDIHIHQKSLKHEYYVLMFTESAITDSLMFKINKGYLLEVQQQSAYILFTSTLFDFACMMSKGTAIKSVNILIPKTWLLKYIAVNNADALLKKYLMLKKGKYNFASFDIGYRSLFDGIINTQYDTHCSGKTVEDRIMLMVKKFVNELASKLNITEKSDKIKISANEVKRLMTVESYLIKDFSIPFPSISTLSRLAAMSTTSLKNKFKKMYGSSLYGYFQKNRMQRAKVLILTHKYSIKEIGSQLGYTNLSNFSIAFKKQFNRLPSRLR